MVTPQLGSLKHYFRWPTSRVWGAKTTNYSVSRHHRAEMALRVKPGTAARAVPTITKIIESEQRIERSPPPIVRVTGIAEGAAVITVWFWTARGQVQAIAADIYLRVIDAFREEGMDALDSPPGAVPPRES